VLEIADVGILHDLKIIVIDETVEQNAYVRQGSAGDQARDKKGGDAVEPKGGALGLRRRRLSGFTGLGYRPRSNTLDFCPRPTPLPTRQTETSPPSFSPSRFRRHADNVYQIARENWNRGGEQSCFSALHDSSLGAAAVGRGSHHDHFAGLSRRFDVSLSILFGKMFSLASRRHSDFNERLV
jgi:hypothetical protein